MEDYMNTACISELQFIKTVSPEIADAMRNNDYQQFTEIVGDLVQLDPDEYKILVDGVGALMKDKNWVDYIKDVFGPAFEED